MKAISLWQPWASLIMLDAKRIETRSWKPPESVIGQRVFIHAAKRLDPCVLEEPFSTVIGDPANAPIGVLLGSVKLEGAWRIDHECEAGMLAREYHRTDDGRRDPAAAERELAFGDFTVGRWAWGLADVRPLQRPLPWNGGQRFWNLGETLEGLLAHHA